ncbi:MAG: hypothetical protein HOP09_14735 [Hyphomicrobium sp.]|nr:hypothetical protein [Hyphomicrobium sp.]
MTTPGASPVEAALVSDRLLRLEEQGAETAKQLHELVALTRRLVEIQEGRDAREREALEIEKARREASAEAETRRLDAELDEKRTARAWWRERMAPVLGGIGSVIVGVATAVAAWFTGVWGGER